MTTIDVTERGFQAEVVERSHQFPVVVDFWAAWCGPCRQLTPVLEQAAAQRDGQVVLAKVDTDANPGLAAAYRIQGIPAVKAFRDGRVVDEFTGARPPAEVARFFDALVPSETDALVAAGDEASLRRALELEPNRTEAAVALADLLHRRGEREEAAGLLVNATGFAAEGLAARLRLEDAGDPSLADAFAALDAGDTERGIDLLLAAMPAADGVTTSAGPPPATAAAAISKDDLRRVVVGVLDGLGVDHPLARDARRRLAAALY
ncbi:MAG TPA: thioredoxin domain-containing protein [Solirubrobacteraceae bacterium]|nr:thioredoxin domain-containing protein [Solirubrobacteraceae bacterium]